MKALQGPRVAVVNKPSSGGRAGPLIARGSAMESAAIVDVIARRNPAEATARASTRALYVRVVQMLTKLDAALAA